MKQPADQHAARTCDPEPPCDLKLKPSSPSSSSGKTANTMPVIILKGIGGLQSAKLAAMGVHTVQDLLMLRPRRYEDRSSLKTISELELGSTTSIHGQVIATRFRYLGGRSRSLFECTVEDSTGRLCCRWWNMPFMKNILRKGQQIFIHGRLKSIPHTMDHPETEFAEEDEDAGIHLRRIVPVYPLKEGIQQRWLRKVVFETLHTHGDQLLEPNNGYSKKGKLSFLGAIRSLHEPGHMEEIKPARQRLALEEALSLQEKIQMRRKHFMASTHALPCHHVDTLIKPFLKSLPFGLTSDQVQVMTEIRRDLSLPHPMRRLLQGDVGTGKTVLAALAALMVLESGHDAMMMVPTTLLADQHYHTFKAWFTNLPIQVALHTGRKAPSYQSDCPSMIIGTHALFHSKKTPANLGMIIVDEQHKFGVDQRESLLSKGTQAHLLVMTATPIPRTMGLTLYGDLDVSFLKAGPSGRGKIKTHIRTPDAREKILNFVKAEIASGRQAYWILPRVDMSGPSALKTITHESQALKKCLAPFKLEMLHGRMNREGSDRIMQSFVSGNFQVLLASTVIEVGLDVPNATVMVVENAEQFGLAQLHQIRGRIGRGSHDSNCILIADKKQEDAWDRLKVLSETHNGFDIAEADFKTRGPGELAGKQQSGTPQWRFLDLKTDEHILREARDRVRTALGLDSDPES
jgi:ATP-dependent DNA helicase RecG